MDALSFEAGQEERAIDESEGNASPDNLAKHLGSRIADTSLDPESIADLPDKLASFAWGYCADPVEVTLAAKPCADEGARDLRSDALPCRDIR